MRSALCIIGQTRTMSYCFPSLKTHLLDVYNPDVFICADGDKEEIVSLFHPVQIETFTQNEIWESIGERRFKYTNHLPVTIPENDLSCAWKSDRCARLLYEYAKINGDYDTIFQTRFDIKFLHIQPVLLPEENVLYVPEVNAYLSPPDHQGYHYGGYSAQLSWSTPKVHSLLAIGMYEKTDEHYELGGLWHTEPQLRWLLETNNIKVVHTDVSMMIIRGTSEAPLSFDYKDLKSCYPDFG